MSKLIALRLPDDVHAEVQKRMGVRGQSEFIINALRVYLEKIEPGKPSSWQQFGAGVPLARTANAPLKHSPTCKCLVCRPEGK